ncbi:MAG TPA: PAS domain S-box protein, partial [Longimicrobium sp.]|nr:PAS domain S-box protein [Longimicrobium sp.]
MRTSSPSCEPSPGADPAGAILSRLADTVVARLRLGASAIVPDAVEAPLHTAGTRAHQQVLLEIILHHRAVLRQTIPDEASVLHPAPGGRPDALAIASIRLEEDAPPSLLLALHTGPWSRAELMALQALADAAGTELRVQREHEARTRAEARLQLLEGALDALDLGVTITDESGRIIFTNAAEARMHGYAVEELYGQTARSLAPPELWSTEPRVPAHPVRRWMRERVNVRRDGTRFPVRL